MSPPDRPLTRKWPEALARLSQGVMHYLAISGGEPSAGTAPSLSGECRPGKVYLVGAGSVVHMVETSPAVQRVAGIDGDPPGGLTRRQRG